MSDEQESEPPRSPKGGGEQDRVKFETQELSSFVQDDLSSNSPKEEGGADSVFSQSGAYSVDGTANSWAPRSNLADAASAALASAQSSGRAGKQDKAKQRRTMRKKKDSPNNPSLSNSALASTLGILKLAGGVTLSTANTVLLSPSLEVTRKVLLPNLFAGIADYLSQTSPQRLKDWFRILSASVHHIISVIVSTDRGSIFRHKVVRVGGDIVDVVSSDTSRQALMDGMACWVKLYEALHTPEFKDFLEQASIMGCRIIDTAAMDKNKKLIHDFFDLVWSGIELANDPATTVAFAEVAAYLCHALEMEDSAIHAIHKKREEINQAASQKRKERDQFQSATYQESYLFQDPNATIEEVILSAFGVIQKSVEEARQRIAEQDSDGIPGSVVLGSEDGGDSARPPRSATPPPSSSKAGSKVSGAATRDNGDEDILGEQTTGIENNGIDVNLLRERISARAEAMKKEHTEKRASATPLGLRQFLSNRQVSAISNDEDDGKMDIEELSALKTSVTPKHKNSNTPLHFEEPQEEDPSENDAGQEDSPNVEGPFDSKRPDRKPKEGETPVDHFYRVLDDVLSDERKRAAKSFSRRTGTGALDAEKDLDSSRLKNSVQEHRSEKRARRPSSTSGLPPAIEKFINENEMLVCGLVLGAICVGFMFFAFALYGIYVFVFPPRLVPHLESLKANDAFATDSEIRLPLVIQDNEQSKNKNEYVIRVIREVVHTNEKNEKGEKVTTETKGMDERQPLSWAEL